MKNIALFIALISLVGCTKETAIKKADEHGHGLKAAEFKSGLGLLFTPEAIDFIGLRSTEAQETEGKIVVNKQALVRTSTGAFIFVQNGNRWLRTQVVTGNESDGKVVILDGLLEGDVYAHSASWDLWLAELQAIKQGVGCTHGH